ncbi:sn1-specific diacylglycerol lipase alpha-like [Stegodyphus dumicola]|uniref:sn1-specific diacylglycerol lipase alpha-like n=1 Tax=Stegodyphus dumicola TaxID=202533 RepID=UPI0015B015A1|nr:sn1-specific diacylglycerol lipase alpha-like [Stegodyphus dumicola]
MQKQNFHRISLYKNESTENCITVPEWMSPENALYFLKIAKSTYGWFALCNTFHPCSFCTLSCPLKCCRQDNEKVLDNCCYYNFAAVQKITGLSDSDILYASFGNSSEEPAFYVAVDHQKKYIIIAIRGTRSFSDLLTVINAEIQDFPSEDTASSFKCHRGVLHSALFLEKKLNDLNILEVALAENPSYAIGITGHCLGGSIAAVLGLMLRPKYPNLQCFIYAPLAVLSVEMIPNTLDFIFTIVVGDDIVPCLCANSCKKLLAEILRSLEETKIPKYKIFMRGFWKYIVKYGKESEKKSQKTCANTQNERDVEITFTDREERTASNNVQLYAPGRILYFEKGDRWKAHWLTGLNISNLFMSPAMRRHHQPYKIQCMLEMYKKGLKD